MLVKKKKKTTRRIDDQMEANKEISIDNYQSITKKWCAIAKSTAPVGTEWNEWKPKMATKKKVSHSNENQRKRRTENQFQSKGEKEGENERKKQRPKENGKKWRHTKKKWKAIAFQVADDPSSFPRRPPYRVLPSFPLFFRSCSFFLRIASFPSQPSTRATEYRVLLRFTGFYWVLLGFT